MDPFGQFVYNKSFIEIYNLKLLSKLYFRNKSNCFHLRSKGKGFVIHQKIIWGARLTNKRPGYDHVTWGPMRGLKKVTCKGDKQIDRRTDIATLWKNQPKGRFFEEEKTALDYGLSAGACTVDTKSSLSCCSSCRSDGRNASQLITHTLGSLGRCNSYIQTRRGRP